MARLIWTEPALADLDAIADYIALDKPDAAVRYVQQVFAAVERLIRFPKSGAKVPETPHLSYRQIVVPPCRIFYRLEGEDILIVFVMRGDNGYMRLI
ncbi:MAG: type II toxin-antitoxin system RelE/ParE family toxin [Kiritimatiellae bacterium]|nr:type II toxin-antitoxin system RelE/ParE family toxin [Kiritimatiellia bacterium]